MTAMARHFDDLGPDFDLRWKRSSRAKKRELIGELRELYIFLEDDEMPLLAGASSTVPGTPARTGMTGTAADDTPAPERPRRIPAAPAKAAQGQLFQEVSHGAETPARKENPFLPKSVLDKLHASQNQATAGLRELMQTRDAPPPSHEQVDLERELRLKLGPVVETLIDAQMEVLRSELRVRLRAEMDRLIAEHVRKI